MLCFDSRFYQGDRWLRKTYQLYSYTYSRGLLFIHKINICMLIFKSWWPLKVPFGSAKSLSLSPIYFLWVELLQEDPCVIAHGKAELLDTRPHLSPSQARHNYNFSPSGMQPPLVVWLHDPPYPIGWFPQHNPRGISLF